MKIMSVRQNGLDFMRGAGCAIQDDLNGIRQIADYISQRNLPKIDVIFAPEQDSLWSEAGSALAHFIEFALIHSSIRIIAKPLDRTPLSEVLPVIALTTSGAIAELVKPVAENDALYPNAKFSQAAIGFSKLATMSAAQNILSSKTIFGRDGRRGFFDSVMANSIAGGVSGGTDAALTALLHDGRAPMLSEIGQATLRDATFGAFFGAVDWKLGRVQLSSKNSPLFKELYPNHKLPATEELVSSFYNGERPISSPILTWLAENRRELRPKDFHKIKTSIDAGLDVDLGSWSPQERVKIVQALRKISNSALTKDDVQIDEFIGAIKQRSLDSTLTYVNARSKFWTSYNNWHTAYNDLLEKIESTAPDFRVDRLIETRDPRIHTTEIQDALAKTLRYENEVARTPDMLSLEKKVAQETATSMETFALRTRLPRLLYDVDRHQAYGYTYLANKLTAGASEVQTQLSSRQIQGEFHEWRHHEQGSWSLRELGRRLAGLGNGTENFIEARNRQNLIAKDLIPRIDAGAGTTVLAEISDATHPVSRIWSSKISAKRTSFDMGALKQGKTAIFAKSIPEEIKNLAAATKSFSGVQLNSQQIDVLKTRLKEQASRLNSDATKLYLKEYIGSKSEREAWSAGLLAEIRARGWGLPETSVQFVVPERKGAKVPSQLTRVVFG